jgi:energy-coupling factor transport system ATP-binding protein
VLNEGTVYLQGTPQEVYEEEKKLAAIGLEPPSVYRLSRQLTEAGIQGSGQLKTLPELVDTLWPKSLN